MIERPDAVRRAADLHLARDLAGRHIDAGQPPRPARGHQQRAPVCQHLHAIRPARRGQLVEHLQARQVQHADRVGHAVADEHLPAVASRTKGVRPFAGGDAADQHRRIDRDVPGLDEAVSGQAHEQDAVLGSEEQVRRHPADPHRPARRLRGQVDGHHLVAVLQRDVHHLALAVDGQVARCLGRREATHQLQRVRCFRRPAVEVHVVQAVGCGHEPAHVRREAQVVGVQDARQRALDLRRGRIDEGQRVADRVGHDHRALVRGQVQVMGLLAGRQAPGLGVVHRVDHADVGIHRVQHEDGMTGGGRHPGQRGGGQPGQQRAAREEQAPRRRAVGRRSHPQFPIRYRCRCECARHDHSPPAGTAPAPGSLPSSSSILWSNAGIVREPSACGALDRQDFVAGGAFSPPASPW